MPHHATQLPPEIPAVVQRLRRQIRAYLWLEGLAAAVIWMGIAFWLGLALDYLPVLAGANEMPRAARMVMLIGFASVMAFLIYRYVIRRAFVRLRDRSLALLLERRFPEFDDALITALDTTEAQDASDQSDLKQAMLSRAVQLAAARSRHVDTGGVLRYRPLLGKSLAAAAALISIGLFGLFSRDAFATWTSRLFLLSDAPWPRRAHIEVLDFPNGQRKVAEGSDLTLRVRAVANRPSPPPTFCTVDFRLSNGERGRVNMSRDGEPRGDFQFYRYDGPPFQGMLEAVDFDVVGFDHRVDDLHVDVVPRPSIVDVQLDCQLPAYMNQPSRRLTWRPGTSLPVGTKVTLTTAVTKPLNQVTVQTLETGQTQTLDVHNAAADLEFSYDLGTLQATTSLEFELLDHEGVTSQQPYRLTINALEDLAPEVDIDLQGIGTAITPQVRLPIVGEIRDDYQVKEAWFQIDRPSDGESHRVVFPLGGGGAIEQTLDLRQQRNDDQLPWSIEPGDKIVISIQASDFYDLGESPNQGQSDPLPLDVVTPQELLALLEARELNLKRRFEQTINELNDTRDSLLRLQGTLTEPTSAPTEEQGEDAADRTSTTSSSPDTSLLRLRVQRAQQEGAKAQQEVQGVAASFADIRDELVNNRVDTPERRDRLEKLIIRPLEVLVADDFTRWLDRLTQLEQQVSVSGPAAVAATAEVIQQTNDLILALQQVLENMLELETFNELLDLVRSILSEQEALAEKTADERKRQDRAFLEE